jgi:hypothetical protein
MKHHLKAPARGLRRRSVAVDRIASKAELAVMLRTQDPVLIYSMGKAGTSTLTATLEQATDRPIIKVHAISPEGIAERRPTHGERPRILWTGEQLRRSFRRSRPWTVISCVREPVARAVSAYFYSGRTDPSPAAVGAFVEELAAHDWFDAEMATTIGLDVYAEPFDPAQGWAVYRHEQFRVLLLRTEDLRRVGPAALQEHLGLAAPPPIVDRNLGVDQELGRAYRAFTDTACLSRALVEAVYRIELAQHFYSPAERDAFARRWTR